MPNVLYAEPIINARLSGKKPADPVIVSLGILNLHRKFDWPVVVCPKPGKYDFGFLADLDVFVGFDWPDAVAAAHLIRAIWLDARCRSCGWFVPDAIAFTPSFINVENQLIAVKHFWHQHRQIQASIAA